MHRRCTEAGKRAWPYARTPARTHALMQVLYRGEQGRVAHEFILDIRDLKNASGISETGALYARA